MNLPTALTVLRIVLTPFVVWEILSEQTAAALVLFAIAAFTDWLDGAAARGLELVTKLGAILDPIADKILMGATILALALISKIPWWFVALVIGRDLLILFAAGILSLFAKVRAFPPSKWGKWSTIIQAVTVVLWMLWGMFPSPALTEIAKTVLWGSATLTVLSGLDYALRGVRMMRCARAHARAHTPA